MEPGSKNSSRVLRPPGGASNISFGTDEEKPPARKDKMASSIFAEPDDPHAHRRNNPPGGKPTGVLCGEPSAPLRRGGGQPNSSGEAPAGDVDNDVGDADVYQEAEAGPEPRDEAPPSSGAEQAGAAGLPSGRRNPPGGKSSLILG